MAYVRKKKTKGGEYYQLVEGRRENGKVKQRVLAHLGKCKTVEKALRWWPGMILRRWHVARDLRESYEVNNFAENLRNDLRGIDLWGRPYKTPEEAEYRRGLALAFMDEDGNMRRRKLRPHQLKEALYEGKDHSGTMFGKRLIDQAEYWRRVDYAEQLEREASELEERYVKLYVINGGDEEEARHVLRDRFQRLLDGYERRSKQMQAIYQQKRRATGASILEIVGKDNPILGLQAAIHGYEVEPPE